MEMCENSITIIASFDIKNITSNHFVFWCLHVSLFDYSTVVRTNTSVSGSVHRFYDINHKIKGYLIPKMNIVKNMLLFLHQCTVTMHGPRVDLRSISQF